MGVFRNNVGRPTNKSIMIRNILKGILVVIVVAGIFAGGYFLNGNQKKDNKKNIVSKKQAQKLIDTINSAEFGYFYSENRNVDNLDNNIILIDAINALPSKTSNETFTKKQVEKSVEKLFGNIKYKHKNLEFYCGT